MGNHNIDEQKNTLSFQEITYSDTISQFMEKVNNNFSKLIENNGGPIGNRGEDGVQGVPAKPKVPIHVWKNGEYTETVSDDGDSEDFEISVNNEKVDLTDAKYQEGHLILLENAHVYILEVDNTVSNYTLKPRFLTALQLPYINITNGTIFGNSIFKISENTIEMSVQDYGLKITNKGIFIKKPNTDGWSILNI